MAAKCDRPRPYPVAMHGVHGHLTRKEANLLYDVVGTAGGGTYLEIGTYEGRSTLCLASGIKDAGADAKVIAVDAFDLGGTARKNREWDTSEDIARSKYARPGRFERVFARFEERGFSDYITLVKGFSVETALLYKDTKFDFIFIDADHSYAGCKTDFETWSPMLKSHRCIAFHDTHLEAVARVVEESGWCIVDSAGTIKVIEKP